MVNYIPNSDFVDKLKNMAIQASELPPELMECGKEEFQEFVDSVNTIMRMTLLNN